MHRDNITLNNNHKNRQRASQDKAEERKKLHNSSMNTTKHKTDDAAGTVNIEQLSE